VATQTRNPTSEVAVTGTWSGTSRHLILDDHPDSGNPATDVTTCSGAGALVLGFSVFTVPANSTDLSVQVLYYDFKNGSQGSVAGSLLRCNDTTNRNSSATHNPGNGNANIALRTDNYATNPKSAAAWTVAEVNGTGTNGLTAFGVRVTDASPTVAFSSVQLQVTYTPPLETLTGTGALSAQDSTLAGSGQVEWTGTGTLAAQASAIAGTGQVEWLGTGALAAQAATISGTGTVETVSNDITGTGALSAQAATVAGAGRGLSTGTGAVAAQASTVSGTGKATWQGTGALSADAATMSGTGEVTGAVQGNATSWAAKWRKRVVLNEPRKTESGVLFN
jgi:hypothetical protein